MGLRALKTEVPWEKLGNKAGERALLPMDLLWVTWLKASSLYTKLQTHFAKQWSVDVGLLAPTPVTVAGLDGDHTEPPLSDSSPFEVHES